MGGVTKLRGRQTRGSEEYNPESESLATDQEVEDRVRRHSELFHGSRSDVTRFYFDIDGNLEGIKTFNSTETLILKESSFTFIDGNLSGLNKKVNDENGDIYLELDKTFNLVDGELDNIVSNKI